MIKQKKLICHQEKVNLKIMIKNQLVNTKVKIYLLKRENTDIMLSGEKKLKH